MQRLLIAVIVDDESARIVMHDSPHNWIFIGANAYDEYTFVSWLNRNVYLRVEDPNKVCLL